MKILLAEDHLVSQRFTAGILQNEGHEVCVVENGDQAVKAAARERFDVILMDIQMPVMDGLEAIANIRHQERESQLEPAMIIALTAYDKNHAHLSYPDAGPDDYLSKPLRPEKLVAQLSEIQRKRDMNTESQGDNLHAISHADSQTSAAVNSDFFTRQATETTPVDGDRICRDAILLNTGDDVELARQLRDMFLGDLPTTLRRFQNALHEADYSSLEHLAHSLKSPLRLFGAVSLVSRVHRIEVWAHECSRTELEKHVEPMLAQLQSFADVLSDLTL